MIKKIVIICLINILIINCGLLYSIEPVNLNALIEEAKKNNPDILAAKKRWDSSLARVPQAKSLEDPNIGVTFEKIPKGTLKIDKTMPEDRMLLVSQMFPFFGKLPLKGKIAVVESQMFAAEYKNKELEVINNLKSAYYDLFMNYKEIQLNSQSLDFLEGIAKIAEAKYSVGQIPQEDVFKINLEIAKLDTDIANLQEENKAKQTRVNTLLNRDPESPLAEPDLQESVVFNKDINSLYKYALENQPELLIFSYAIEKNKYAKDLAKKSFFPDLLAGIAQRGITSGMIGPWDLMLSLSVPLWFWTKQRYQVKEAIANLDEAQSAYLAMKNKAFRDVKDLAAKIEISKNKIKLYKANLIPMLEGSIASNMAGVSSGKTDFMMLLDTERMLIETKMDYYKALVEYNMNLADLERMVGVELNEVKR